MAAFSRTLAASLWGGFNRQGVREGDQGSRPGRRREGMGSRHRGCGQSGRVQISQGVEIMATAVVKTEPQAGFSAQEIDLIKAQIAKGASDLELKFFLELCKQSGLNPFTRQIYLIERRERTLDGTWVSRRVPQT